MFQNRPVWIVRDCGISLEEVKDWDAEVASLTTELTDEERKSPYSKYYLRQLKMPSHENLKAVELDNPLPEECMFMPDQLASRLAGDFRVGYGVMENGIGFSLSRVRLDGVTDEKIQYFIRNFRPEGDLYYKSWYPGTHMRHYVNGAVEDVGLGTELIRFEEHLGPDDLSDEYSDPLLCCVVGESGVSWPLHDLFNKPRYCLCCHYFRDLPDHSGKEAISMFWHGLSWREGKAVKMTDKPISVDRVRSQMCHAVWEFSQVPELINEFYLSRQ